MSGGGGGPRRPYLVSLRGNSLDDGPGIRTVVFFKGCPLACDYCHNPETRSPQPELAFDPSACVGCHDCVRACPEGALVPGLAGFVDRGRCTKCFDCVDVCPSRALERVGLPWDLPAILRGIERDLPFFRASGGGVTLSGGEPTMYLESCAELAAALKARGVHVLLETCGDFPLGRFLEELAPHVDSIYFDVKLIDEAAHLRVCGRSNARILENLRALAALAREGRFELLPRVPLVPGRTATPENLAAIAALLRELGLPRVAVLPYNPLGATKADRLGVTQGCEERSFMSPAAVSAARAAFAGLELVG